MSETTYVPRAGSKAEAAVAIAQAVEEWSVDIGAEAETKLWLMRCADELLEGK